MVIVNSTFHHPRSCLTILSAAPFIWRGRRLELNYDLKQTSCPVLHTKPAPDLWCWRESTTRVSTPFHCSTLHLRLFAVVSTYSFCYVRKADTTPICNNSFMRKKERRKKKALCFYTSTGSSLETPEARNSVAQLFARLTLTPHSPNSYL